MCIRDRACQDGLYQCTAGESPKQLLQGTLCSMGDPSNGKYGMLVEDGPVFLVLFSSGLSLSLIHIYYEWKLESQT